MHFLQLRKNYYYLNQPVKNNRYIDCANEQTKPSNYYFNKKNEDYESVIQLVLHAKMEEILKKIIVLLATEFIL